MEKLVGGNSVADLNSWDEMEIEGLLTDNITIAEEKKRLGNDQYKAQNYVQALNLYSDAIALYPKSAGYYGNRSACYMMLGHYKLALEDSREAVAMENKFLKAHLRIAKCCLILGDIIGAQQAINNILEIEPAHNAVNVEKKACEELQQLEMKIQISYTKKIYRTTVFLLDNALRIAHANNKYKVMRAECLAFLGRLDEAADIAVNIMKIDTNLADAIYVRGLCLYYDDHLDKGIIHFERALKLDPDHKNSKVYRNYAKMFKEKKETGNILFNTGKYREAYACYSEALLVDPNHRNMQSKLHYNRALVNARLGNLREAISDCDIALSINNIYLKPLLLRAKANNDLGKFEDSVKDYEAALKIQKTSEIKTLLREAKISLKKSKRKDYYKILGIEKISTEDEIKKAYRKKALVHHPDRHSNSSEADKKEHELKFKEIGEAYSVLSDQKKKNRYDSGQDLEEEGQDFDPNQLFRHFFQFTGDSGNAFSFQF